MIVRILNSDYKKHEFKTGEPLIYVFEPLSCSEYYQRIIHGTYATRTVLYELADGTIAKYNK